MIDRPVSHTIERAKSLWEWAQTTRPWRAWSRFTDVGGNVLAAGMSYQAVFAVFAALWVGFSIFGIWLRSRPEILDSLIDQLNRFVPGLLGDGDSALVSIDALLSAGFSGWTGIIAGASLTWVALTWFTGTRRAIRIIFGLEVNQYRNALLLKLRDFVLAVCFMVALLISAALTVASTNITELVLGWIGADPSNWLLSGIGVTLRYAVLYVFDVFVLLGIHWLLAEVHVGRWHLIRGCALGGIALFALKLVGTLLLGGATRNPLLATFVVFVGLMIWFNLVCRVLLLTASWIAAGAEKRRVL